MVPLTAERSGDDLYALRLLRYPPIPSKRGLRSDPILDWADIPYRCGACGLRFRATGRYLDAQAAGK